MIRGKGVKALLTTAIVLATLLLPRVTAAQGPSSSRDRRDGGRLPGRLQLTREQAQKLDEIRAKYEANLLSLEEEVASKRRELDAAAASSDTAPEMLTRLRQQVRDLAVRLENLQAEANAAARRVLSRDQIALFGDGFDLFDGGWGWSCPWDRHWTSDVASDHWRSWGCDRWWCSDWRYSTGPYRGHGDRNWSNGGCCW